MAVVFSFPYHERLSVVIEVGSCVACAMTIDFEAPVGEPKSGTAGLGRPSTRQTVTFNGLVCGPVGIRSHFRVIRRSRRHRCFCAIFLSGSRLARDSQSSVLYYQLAQLAITPSPEACTTCHRLTIVYRMALPYLRYLEQQCDSQLRTGPLAF